MANVSAASENADQLRRRANRRLLGASVLLLIAIILVPIFLEREPPPLPDNLDVKIPPVEGTRFDPRLPERRAAPTEIPTISEPTGAQAGASAPPSAPVAAQVAAAAKAAATSVTGAPGATGAPTAPSKAPETAATKAAAAATSAPPATESAPKGAAAAPVAAQESSAPKLKSGQLVVQLIAVRDPDAAKQILEKAKTLKFTPYTERVTVPNGVVTRVRVGPYDTKQAAEAARAKLARAGIEAKVIVLP